MNAVCVAHAAAATSLALIAATGCEARHAEPRGLGPYRFGTTTRAQLTQGVCQPTELSDGRKATWCFGLPPIKVGKRVAEVDAYFLGSDLPLLGENPTAEQRAARKQELEKLPLIELQLKIRGCVENEADAWMRSMFGPSAETLGTKVIWYNSFFWAIAFLPSEPGRCHVHFLPRTEVSEIERLKRKEPAKP